jgi:DNA-binding SARP family transcriptional activator/tetratricopeptide (TPR) repeat protein
MEFLLLGPFEAHADGQAVGLGRRHQRRLLGVLLLEARHPVPVERLVDLIWDGHPPESARSVLHTHISRLRSILQPHGVQVVTRGDAYLADAEPDDIDTHRFIAMVAEARRLTGPAERAAMLCDALALWRGPLMCDVADDRLRERVGEGLAELRLSAVELLTEARLAEGQHDRVATDLADVVRQHPTRERLVGLLMTALYRAGRQVDALARYRETRDLLRAEFGVDPGEELTRLHHRVLTNDAALSAPSVMTAEPMPAGRSPGRGNLPRQMADFVGREVELATLDGLVRGGGPPPAVVITAIGGAGGIGKTALAVLWAHRAAAHFGDGQLYVDLHGYDGGRPVRPVDALARLLRTLGVPNDQLPTDLDQATDLYRATVADKRLIVVLDNARSVDQVRPLIPGGSGCFVVVTSRDRLGGLIARDGAVPVTLGLLEPWEALDLLTRVVGAARVDAEPDAAAELAHRCGYLPLALRIAAAHLVLHPDRTITAQVAELGSGRLAALTVDGDDSIAITSVFDQSYTALGDRERHLLRTLGVVAVPDLTPEAAAAAADTTVTAATALLGNLLDAHLVVETAPGRFGLHDLLREYARQRAAQDDPADRVPAVRRLLAWYLDHIDGAAARLYPYKLRLYTRDSPLATFPGPAEASAWLVAERACLLAAIAHAADTGLVDPAVRILDGLRNYFDQTHDSVSTFAAVEPVLAVVRRAGDQRAQALAHLALAAAYGRVPRPDLAVEHYHACVEASEAGGWDDGLAAAANSLGSIYVEVGRADEGIALLRRALELNRRSGRRQAEATNLGNLGFAYLHTGPVGEAGACLSAALEIRREIGPASGQVAILSGLGNSAYYQRRFAEAAQYHQEAMTMATEAANVYLQAAVLDNLAALNADLGRLDEALAQAESAMAYLRGEAEEHTGDILNTLATVHLRLGHLPLAVELYEQSITLARRRGIPLTEANALVGLATIHGAAGRWDEAEQCGQHALRIAVSRGLRPTEGYALTVLAEINLGRGDIDEAAVGGRAALDVMHGSGALLMEPRARAVLDRTRS